MEKWTGLKKTSNIAQTLTRQLIRIQRLVIKQRLDEFKTMLKMHEGNLLKNPVIKEKLKKIEEGLKKERN